MSVARHNAAHTVLENHLFVIGGDDEDGSVLDLVEIYDPSTNQWQTMAPMLHERQGAAACASHQCIYVFGGMGAYDYVSSFERYDPNENSW